jgi:transglutaminase-like putative cysteine protease
MKKMMLVSVGLVFLFTVSASYAGDAKKVAFEKVLSQVVPFPTKSLQPYPKLKEWGIVGSDVTNLGLFYKQEGPQTKFTDLVRTTASSIRDGATTEDTVKNIMQWEQDNLRGGCEGVDTNSEDLKRSRTASDIIQSKCAAGCTDYTLVFATLARVKGIAATVTETVFEKWVAEMAWSNEWDGNKQGHFFSEVYLPEKRQWVVVDPTSNIFSSQDPKGYYIGPPYEDNGGKKYLLFERGLDSWDYGVLTMKQFGDIVKKRYYIESGDQP